MGRRRLPPDEMRWFATSGIMVTSEPVRDRIIALTRSMSEATRDTSLSMLAFFSGCLSSNGTTTPTSHYPGCRPARPVGISVPGRREIAVVDMGSGKGYLTFAVYDYFNNTLGLDARVTGVEARGELA